MTGHDTRTSMRHLTSKRCESVSEQTCQKGVQYCASHCASVSKLYDSNTHNSKLVALFSTTSFGCSCWVTMSKSAHILSLHCNVHLHHVRCSCVVACTSGGGGLFDAALTCGCPSDIPCAHYHWESVLCGWLQLSERLDRSWSWRRWNHVRCSPREPLLSSHHATQYLLCLATAMRQEMAAPLGLQCVAAVGRSKLRLLARQSTMIFCTCQPPRPSRQRLVALARSLACPHTVHTRTLARLLPQYGALGLPPPRRPSLGPLDPLLVTLLACHMMSPATSTLAAAQCACRVGVAGCTSPMAPWCSQQ